MNTIIKSKIDIKILPVAKEDKQTLKNLLEKYEYEFSQYDERDVNKHGLYGYCTFDSYWSEEKRWPFFIVADGNLAGFIMVRNFPNAIKKTDYTMTEFFVMHKYRRQGIGTYAAMEIFDMCFMAVGSLKRTLKTLFPLHFGTKR